MGKRMIALPSRTQFKNDASADSLLSSLENLYSEEWDNAAIYLGFPLYRDDEGGLIVPDILILTKTHGIIAVAVFKGPNRGSELERCKEICEQVPSFIYSRLIKNRQLRSGATQLIVPINCFIYSPFSEIGRHEEVDVVQNSDQLHAWLEGVKLASSLADASYNEITATIEGAKGLIRPVKRVTEIVQEETRGTLADKLEEAITLFDQQQKHGMMGRVTGPQRIRGLAGSGKTVVLAMKAAQAHLQNPEAKIVYTFYTKSLYQHVKRLITRFYRQFDDRDPDWDNLHIVHGWGGSSTPGLYSFACEKHGVDALTFQQTALAVGDRFDFACSDLLSKASIQPYYDYIFVDEGQDFPMSFVRLCHAFAKGGKFVLAYDDLQTIFQAISPDSGSIFGTDSKGRPRATFEEDVVLHKCYRNPREILLIAHALGFGVYGKRIVQMLESKEHWEDIGYLVLEGEFAEGSHTKISRPKPNSLSVLSDATTPDDLIQVKTFGGLAEETEAVARQIGLNLSEGLRPQDVLVIAVDDLNAKKYLAAIEIELAAKGVKCNNLHSDSYGIRDFSYDGRVTLSTVHKAKGNEAFMVYVVGCDAVISKYTPRKRNMLFTALTRAKGWVRLSGVSPDNLLLEKEVTMAKANFPCLIFEYPGPDYLKVMKRDLAEAADRKLKARRLMEQFEEEFSDEEIEAYFKMRRSQKKSDKGKKGGRRK